MGSFQLSHDSINSKQKSAISYVRVLFETLEKMLQSSATLKDEEYKVGIYHSPSLSYTCIETGNFSSVCPTFSLTYWVLFFSSVHCLLRTGKPDFYHHYLDCDQSCQYVVQFSVFVVHFFIYSKEHKISKKVEFEIFCKMVCLLGCDVQTVKQTRGAHIQDEKVEEMDEDGNGDEDEEEHGVLNCAPLLQSLYSRICGDSSLPGDSGALELCEERMDTSSSTRVLAEHVVEAVSDCVHLLLDYDVFQVRLKRASALGVYMVVL